MLSDCGVAPSFIHCDEPLGRRGCIKGKNLGTMFNSPRLGRLVKCLAEPHTLQFRRNGELAQGPSLRCPVERKR